jgi:hypothetical protein
MPLHKTSLKKLKSVGNIDIDSILAKKLCYYTNTQKEFQMRKKNYADQYSRRSVRLHRQIWACIKEMADIENLYNDHLIQKMAVDYYERNHAKKQKEGDPKND